MQAKARKFTRWRQNFLRKKTIKQNLHLQVY